MSATRRFPVIDADGHVMERDQTIYEYLPAPFHGQEQLFMTSFFPTLDGWHRSARRVADGLGRVIETPTAQDWLSYLDEAEIAATVLFPTSGLGFGLIADPDWAGGLAQGYNNWVYDKFMSVAPKRLKAVALIPLQDPDRAAAELRRAVTKMGFVGAFLPAVGLWEAFGHRAFWPVYEAAQELDVPVTVHGGAASGIGVDRLHRAIEMRALNHVMSQLVQMTSMVFGGVFDAFPRLRVAYLEAGCGWASYLLERLDREYAGRHTQVPHLKVKPSEHLRSGRVFIHTELEEDGLSHAVNTFGEDVFVCASDYPHEPKGDFIEVLEEFEERQDLSESARRKILWDNPVRLFKLDEAELKNNLAQKVGATG